MAFSKTLTIAIKEWGWIQENPMFKVSKPKGNKGRERFLSEEEIQRLCCSIWQINKRFLMQEHNKKLFHEFGCPEYVEALQYLEELSSIDSLTMQFSKLIDQWLQLEPITSERYNAKKKNIILRNHLLI